MQHGKGAPNSARPPNTQRTSWIPRDDGIPALKAELSAFHATDRLHKRRFESIKEGIFGLTDVSIGRLSVRAILASPKDAGQTSRAFLIADATDALLCEIPAFNGINLRTDRIQIVNEKGQSKFIFAIPPLVLRTIKDMASSEAGDMKPVNSLLPPMMGMSDPALDIVTSRLGLTIVLGSSNGLSENGLRSLAAEITVVLTMRDPENKQYYYLVLGQEAESAYRLYMSALPEGISTVSKGHYIEVHQLKYKDREMLLCREV